MRMEEKRNKVNDYCTKADCDSCVLAGSNIKPNFDCLEICSATEEQLDKALALINGVPDSDNVNHPNHYQGAHECIDVMVAMFGKEAVKSFCRCNAYKYRFRSQAKNGDEDIKKAEWYEDYLIKLCEE